VIRAKEKKNKRQMGSNSHLTLDLIKWESREFMKSKTTGNSPLR
jgi:hypothetical protein